ncbi:MAG: P-loop NTPase fold protein [Phycisphaerae bacterium]|jgi:hypothetical protein
MSEEADSKIRPEEAKKNNEEIPNKYKFTLLREEAVEVDSFEDRTHDKIAETLFNLIKTEKGGVTVGLEGTWGSGKSAVISILRKKLKREKNIYLFAFDAWAHEGDPLRRIFLESLIENLFQNKNGVTNKLQEKIAKRIKHRDIKTTRSATGLGKLLAIATFFVPLGIVLMSKVEGLTFEIRGNPHWLFLISLFFVLFPIWILLGNLIRLVIKKLKVCEPKNWVFMQQEANEDIVQEVSEDEERSSIEFERYFLEIMKLIFDDDPDKKLVMVIDNLDRVDPDDSLKIWSTLQTFLQQRSTPTKTQNWFEKIWIIVPYDPEGLAGVWNKNKETRKESGNKDTQSPEMIDRAQFFFDKCFQIKLEVPKPILTAWERFTRDKINEALAEWDSDDRKDVLDVLELTRENLDDIPTPRQIKNYINQVGLMRIHCNQKVATKSIAYYVIQRSLNQLSVEEIRENLRSRKLPDQRSARFLPESCMKDMAGLIFGVSPKKGQILLLEPDISKALISGEGEQLKKIQEIHSDGFWFVFLYHIRKRVFVFDDLLFYSKAIYDGLWSNYKDRLHMFSKIAIDEVSKGRYEAAERLEINWPDESKVDFYSCLAEILNEPDSCKLLYKKLLYSLNSQIGTNEQFDIPKALKVLQRLVEAFNIDKPEKLSDLNYDKFLLWAQASLQSAIPAWKWIVPERTIADDMSKHIRPGEAISEGVKEAFDYLVLANVSGSWQELVISCQNHIQHNNGNLSGESHSPEVFEIILTLSFRFSEYDDKIKGIVTDWRFHNLAWTFRGKLMPTIALLCGKYMGRELIQFSPARERSPNFAIELKAYWNNRDKNNAKELLSRLKEYDKWSFLWELIENSNNKLVVDIILLALEDEGAAKLFKIKDGLQKLKSYFNLFEGDQPESIDLIVSALIKYSGLEKEIVENTELNILECERELDAIVTNSSNKNLHECLANKLKSQSGEAWSNALKNDTYLTSLAIAVQEKLSKFWLGHSYAEAFLDFVKNNSGSESDLSEWQINHWQKLVSLRSKEFISQYKHDWTKFLIENSNAISDEMINLNNLYCDFEKIKQNVDFVQDLLRNAIKEKNFKRLVWINQNVLSSDKGKKFKPNDYFPKTIKEPLNDLNREEKEESNNENVKLIDDIATKLKVKLVDVNKEEEKKNEIEKILFNNKWRLFSNPKIKPGPSKIMCFGERGLILEGKNDNESSWQISNGFIELIDSNGKVHSRFTYDSKNNQFNHTNDADTGSILKHSIQDQYMIPEVS